MLKLQHNTNHRLYHIWEGIKTRCYNQNSTYFNNYGGRGIKVCDRWVNSFENFREDMYPTFKEGLTIDRINNNGNYEPSNCRWASKSVQSRNTRKIRSNNTSGYRGVCYEKTRKLYKCVIRINGILKNLGRFKTEIEAAKVYDDYVIENKLEHTKNF